MTPRQRYNQKLRFINDHSNGRTYYRTLTFAEAEDWMNSYREDIIVGWDSDLAADRAWDIIFASKGSLV